MAKVLVVEDSKVVNKIITTALAEQGHQIESCYSVEAAIAVLKQMSCDLIITDMIMPGKDGTEFLEYLARALPEKKNTTAILAISSGSADTVAADTLLGSVEDQVDMVLAKPFSKEIFMETVDKLLKVSRVKKLAL